MARQPTFSVVICVYNGGNRIAHTLRSLEKLDYPSSRLEVVVVDDGSTDHTADVVRGFSDARLVTHERNLGHSAARNTGLKTAKGRYVAYIDDDCIADPQWLTELEKTLEEPNTIAAGGYIGAHSQAYITQRYLARSGYGRPAPVALGQAKNIWQRFTAYVRDKFSQAGQPDVTSGPVCEVYGANAAFPRNKLTAVDGFPTEIRTSEDAAICQRLRAKYPDETIRFNAKAMVAHEFTPTFGAYLHEVFRRQGDTIAYHRLLNKMPPIFPFPIAIIAAIVAAGFIRPWLSVVMLLVAPLLAYSWWLFAAFKRRSPEYVWYSYMQFFEELTRDAGLCVAGLARLSRPYPHVMMAVVTLAAALGGVHLLHWQWLALPAGLLAIVVPGYLLLLALNLRRLAPEPLKRLAFMAMLGVMWNMAIGLLAVWLLPLWGDNRPLEAAAILSVFGIGIAIVAFIAAARRRSMLPVRDYRSSALSIFLWIAALALPVCSIIGANLLNRGGTNMVTVATLAVVVLLLGVTAWKSRSLPDSLLPAVLFSASLTALFSYTMRSSALFGWDIQQEYEVFLRAQSIANWTIGQVHNPYDAMLSLTVFPNVLGSLSGLSGLAIFKMVFPLLFSFVPVILYYIYRIWAKRWMAFIAAGIFIAQFYYFQEFAALARQQLAFLFFAGLLYVLLQQAVKGPRRLVLGVLLALGIVVSHYSTTYMAIALLGGAFILAKLFYVIRRRQWLPRAARVVPLWVVAALLGGAMLWYGPATHSSAAFSRVNEIARGDTDLAALPERAVRIVQDKLNGNDTGDRTGSDSSSYLQNIGADYRENRGYLSYYPDADNADIQPVNSRQLPERLPLLKPLAALADVALRYAWWIFGALGALWFVWRAWKHFNYRDSEAAALIGMALLAFIAIHVIPGVDQYYNIPRLNQQALMFTALPAVAGLAWLARRYLGQLWRIAVAAPLLVAFLIASGLMAQGVGGTPHANLNNFGIDYQHFYIHQSEIAAAKWLDQDRKERSDVIYADRYTNLRLVVPTDINGHVMQDITPQTLAKHAYVFAGQTNIVDGVSMAGYKGGVTTFQFPLEFITSHKNTLYTNGYAGVYK